MTEHAVFELLSREQIRMLALRYAAAVEARDTAAMAALYSPRADFGHYGTGPEGMRAAMKDALRETVFAVILVANHLIDVHDDAEATGQVWARCYAQRRTGGFLEQLIKYEDRYEQVDGRWLFVHRRHRLWYGVGQQSSPLLQPPAQWPRSQVGVGDVPLADPDFRAWWEGHRDA